MKKKFLISIAGLFAMALAFTFSASTDNNEYSALFVDSDIFAC